jgi:hypothetical protein
VPDYLEAYTTRIIGAQCSDFHISEVLADGRKTGNYDLNEIFEENLENTNAEKRLIDRGSAGSYIDLKDGMLIANNGIFRGSLEVEEMKVEKSITLGNLQTGKYITIDPDGVSLGSQSIVYVSSGSGGGSGTEHTCLFNPEDCTIKDLNVTRKATIASASITSATITQLEANQLGSTISGLISTMIENKIADSDADDTPGVFEDLVATKTFKFPNSYAMPIFSLNGDYVETRFPGVIQ